MNWAALKERITISKFFPYLLLFIAILAVSSASVIIVKLQEKSVPSDIIAMYRTLFAGIGAMLLSLKGRKASWAVQKATRRHYPWIVLSGVMLAIHFTTWFFSLKFVSVAISTTIVDTTPVFLAIFGFIFFKEKINIFGISGIIIAFSGEALLTFSEKEGTITYSKPILGALLATVGAITVSIYLLIGKKILKDSPLWPYFGLVNLIAAFTLLLYSLILRHKIFNYDSLSFLFFILLALAPSLVGHAIYNYTLRRLAAFIVGMAILGEPIGATILAIIVLQQVPSLATTLYILLILVGIFLTFSSPYLKLKSRNLPSLKN